MASDYRYVGKVISWPIDLQGFVGKPLLSSPNPEPPIFPGFDSRESAAWIYGSHCGRFVSANTRRLLFSRKTYLRKSPANQPKLLNAVQQDKNDFGHGLADSRCEAFVKADKLVTSCIMSDHPLV